MSLEETLWQAAESALSNSSIEFKEVIALVGPCLLKPRKPKSLFEALLSSIVYQQLSGKAAATIYSRVRTLFPRGRPTPRAFLRLPHSKLRSVGLSRPKIKAARNLASACIGSAAGARDKGSLPTALPSMKKIEQLSDDDIRAVLTTVKGIGPWTANMFLMFDLGRPNVLPENDLGIQKAVGRLYCKGRKATPKQVLKHGARWAPWCTVASWYLWRSLDVGIARMPGER